MRKMLLLTFLIVNIFLVLSAYAEDEDFKIYDYMIQSGGLGYYVQGSIRNNSGKTCNLCVNFALYSSIARDRFLGSVVGCENGIREGATWQFKTTSIETNYRPGVADVIRINSHCY